jgi:hypothetical protein
VLEYIFCSLYTYITTGINSVKGRCYSNWWSDRHVTQLRMGLTNMNYQQEVTCTENTICYFNRGSHLHPPDLGVIPVLCNGTSAFDQAPWYEMYVVRSLQAFLLAVNSSLRAGLSSVASVPRGRELAFIPPLRRLRLICIFVSSPTFSSVSFWNIFFRHQWRCEERVVSPLHWPRTEVDTYALSPWTLWCCPF